MARKLYDLAVKLGSYTDNQGNEKGRWQNVGAMMEGQDGNKFLLLDRHFNPGGLPNPDNRTNTIVSCFEPKGQQQGNQGGGYQQDRGGYGGGGRPSDDRDLNGDSIPFAPETRI